MLHERLIYSCYYLLFLGILVTCDTVVKRKNFTLYKVIAFSKQDRQILYAIHRNFDHVNFLNGVTNEAAIPMHVAVDNNYLKLFEAYLNSSDCIYIKYDQYAPVPRNLVTRAQELTNDSSVFSNFNDFRTIQKIYKYWGTKYPKNFKKIIIGRTEENNELAVLKVYHPSSHPAKKKATVFVLGGEEGRDWMSSAVILGYVKKLLEGVFDDPGKHKFWTQRFDMYFLPVSNPDGYSYSLYKDRFYAKNKKSIPSHRKCPNIHKRPCGVNVDRNWLYGRKANEACSKIYLGQYLSENETSKVADFLDSLAPRMLGFFNVRGFDNLITTPFADNDRHQNNINTIMEILNQVCHDMNAAFNKSFYYGTTARLLFNYTGNCADWVKQYLNVPVVTTLYLKHEDHVLPEPGDIVSLCNEFSGGMNLILTLTIDLYEPLFNSQSKLTIFNVVTSLCMFNILTSIRQSCVF